MKKRFMNIAALALSAALLFTGLPAQVFDAPQAADVVYAAPEKPANVSISLKRISSSKVEATASWSGQALGYSYRFYYDDGHGGYGKLEGAQTTKSISYTFDHKEGDIYTYTIKVRSMDGNNGPYSAWVKKSKTYMNTGSYTKKIKSLVKKNTSGMSDFEKVRFAHDWLVKNVDYDQEMDMETSTTLAGTMKNKKAVCQGYAIAFGVFMKYMGIPAKYVISNNKNHMWNMVKLGGKWYHVDVTWDDPMGMEDVTKTHPAYDYFLQSTKNFQAKDSSADHKFKTSKYPKAKTTTYDNKGSMPDYYEAVPGDNSGLQYGCTFSPWKNGKKIN